MKLKLVPIFVLTSVVTLFAQNDKEPVIDQIWIPSVTITNPDTIKYIIDQLYIPEKNVEKIEIIDVNSNGFGEKDILRIFSLEQDSLKLTDVYFMEGVGKKLRTSLRKIKFKTNVQIYLPNRDQMSYEKTNDPYYSILGAIAEGLQRNYQDYLPIKISMKRDTNGVTMEFWGFDSTKIRHRPLQARQNIFYIYTTEKDSIIVGN